MIKAEKPPVVPRPVEALPPKIKARKAPPKAEIRRPEVVYTALYRRIIE
jgi:hypothetical protein